MADITFKQGEAKTLRFTVTSDDVAVDLSDPTTVLTFVVKRYKRDTSYIIEKEDADFDKTDAALGIVTVPISATDTDQTPVNYIGELKIRFSATNIDLSGDKSITIQEAVID